MEPSVSAQTNDRESDSETDTKLLTYDAIATPLISQAIRVEQQICTGLGLSDQGVSAEDAHRGDQSRNESPAGDDEALCPTPQSSRQRHLQPAGLTGEDQPREDNPQTAITGGQRMNYPGNAEEVERLDVSVVLDPDVVPCWYITIYTYDLRLSLCLFGTDACWPVAEIYCGRTLRQSPATQ